MNNIFNFDKNSIKIASEFLISGDVIAFATETVYGLGADARSDKAVSKIFKLKNRPDFNPLIVHVNSLNEVFNYVYKTPLAIKLAEKYWPGPLTLILERKKACKISLLVSAGLNSIAIRIPNHKPFLNLLNSSKIPIAAPSANKSGKLSPTCANDVRDDFGDNIKMILDDGFTKGGLESTVIDARNDNPILLRPGLISSEEIEKNLKVKFLMDNNIIIESPGQLLRHYSPNSKLIINSTLPQDNDAFLTFKNIKPDKKFSGIQLNLSKKGNLEEVASNLFKMLRKVDKKNPNKIVVAPIPDKGVGRAINNRLQRASNQNGY
ncbi:MAG: threonylcarbamoyl-AMP synthase [Rickettsiales bacterium]|nr:threonylcarbamoyl-AMP synthase [Rickettsiales bacterium]